MEERLFKKPTNTVDQPPKCKVMDDELTTTSIIFPFAPAKLDPLTVYTSCATKVVKKNIDTPMGPRSAKTPVAGKMIIPSG